MTSSTPITSALILGLCCAFAAFAQNDLSFYPVRTLAEAFKDSVDPDSAKADYYLDGRQLKSRTTVTFTGEVRKVRDNRRKFIDVWLESRGLPKDVARALENEAEVQEGELKYWMPIRARTIGTLAPGRKEGNAPRRVHNTGGGGD